MLNCEEGLFGGEFDVTIFVLCLFTAVITGRLIVEENFSSSQTVCEITIFRDFLSVRCCVLCRSLCVHFDDVLRESPGKGRAKIDKVEKTAAIAGISQPKQHT